MLSGILFAAISMSAAAVTPYELAADEGVFGQAQNRLYETTLASALLRDPYRIAQTVLTSGVEQAVYVRSVTMQFPDAACEIVHNRMQRRLASLMQDITAVELSSRQVIVIRKDGTRVDIGELTTSSVTSIDPELCSLLSEVWTKGLSIAEIPKEGSNQLITNLGFRYHFGTMRRGLGYKTATLKGVETVGPPASMIAISKMMIELADAEPADRASIRERVTQFARKALTQME